MNLPDSYLQEIWDLTLHNEFKMGFKMKNAEVSFLKMNLNRGLSFWKPKSDIVLLKKGKDDLTLYSMTASPLQMIMQCKLKDITVTKKDDMELSISCNGNTWSLTASSESILLLILKIPQPTVKVLNLQYDLLLIYNNTFRVKTLTYRYQYLVWISSER
jgi:hypothetical protein